MRAAVMREWGAPSVLKIEEVADAVIGPSDVLVRVAACGVPYHDIVQRNGTMRRGTEFPMILGYEIAGTVKAVGHLVEDFAVGDRVCNKPWHSCGMCRYCRTGMETACLKRKSTHGGYAEQVALPEEVLVKIPDQLSFEAACMLGGSAAVALNAVRDTAEVKLGDTVLVTGASGGVGLPSVQLARAAGAQVIALSRSAFKSQALKEAGAHHVVVAADDEDFSKAVKAITGPKGVDVVIDNVGSRVFKSCFKSLGFGGRYVMVGQLFREDISINPAFIFFQRARILGVGSARRDQLEDAVALAARGVVTPRVARVLPLEAIVEAHTIVESGGEVGRVVVTP